MVALGFACLSLSRKSAISFSVGLGVASQGPDFLGVASLTTFSSTGFKTFLLCVLGLVISLEDRLEQQIFFVLAKATDMAMKYTVCHCATANINADACEHVSPSPAIHVQWAVKSVLVFSAAIQ